MSVQDLWFQSVSKGDLDYILNNISSCNGMRNENGETALHMATLAGDIGTVRALVDLEHGALNDKGATALILAAINDNLEIFTVLFPYERLINLPDGRTPLEVAASVGSVSITKFLVDSDQAMTREVINKAFLYAVSGDHHECVSIIGDFYALPHSILISANNIAAEKRYTEVSKYLSKLLDKVHGADLALIQQISDGCVDISRLNAMVSVQNYASLLLGKDKAIENLIALVEGVPEDSKKSYQYIASSNTDTKAQSLTHSPQLDNELREYKELVAQLQAEIEYLKERLALENHAVASSMYYSSRQQVESSTDEDPIVLPKKNRPLQNKDNSYNS